MDTYARAALLRPDAAISRVASPGVACLDFEPIAVIVADESVSNQRSQSVTSVARQENRELSRMS